MTDGKLFLYKILAWYAVVYVVIIVAAISLWKRL